MKRRGFTAMLGAAGAWAHGAFGQEAAPMRRLGVVLAVGQTAEYVRAMAALERALASLGWGVNLRVDVRWSAGSAEGARGAAREMAALAPDVVLGQSTTVIQALRAALPATPIVFVHVADPVAAGLVSSLARPGGNVTGITNIEPALGGKWLQLLKEVAPGVTRAALLVNPDTQADRGALFRHPFETAARTLGIASVDGAVLDVAAIDSVMAALARSPGGGVVVTPDAFFASHSARIVALAARLRLPAVYPYRYYVAQGGLLSYGVDNVDLFRQAAPYVDRILRGAKPSDLPVQQPTRFELDINVRTARSLGLELPASLRVRADELIR